MPVQNQTELVAKVAEPLHSLAPSARELRAQAVQRLQMGLAGLAAMLLLVGLASIINDQLRRNEPPVAATPASPAPKADPLSDIGVMPSASPSPSPGPDAALPHR